MKPSKDLLLPYFEAIVSPGAEFELTMLIIEGKPCYVNLARALEYSRWNVEHRAVRRGHNVGLEGSVKPREAELPNSPII